MKYGAKRLLPETWVHGLYGTYLRFGCRCDLCVTGYKISNSLRMKKYINSEKGKNTRRKNYQKKKEKINEQIRNQKLWLDSYKETRGCKNCPESDPVCLQFHHRDPLTKKFQIADKLVANYKTNKELLEEIDKCDILCANCHFKLHAKQKLLTVKIGIGY